MMRLTPAIDDTSDTTSPTAASVESYRSGRPRTSATRPMKLPLPTSDLWPAEVDMILSAMQAGGAGWLDQRRSPRTPYRVRAELTFYADRSFDPSTVLFCRDIDSHGMGFITTEPLPLGYGGVVAVFTPAGVTLRLPCTLIRCREAVSGWYEGALNFHDRQTQFDGDF